MKEVKEELVNPTTSCSWVQNVIFVGKTAGGFGLLMLYFFTPKPYLACQFATLSLTRGLPGESPSEVEKENQGGRLEDVRQESTIGTTVESEASGSVLLQGWPTNPEEVRRTSSSAVSIQPRESGDVQSSAVDTTLQLGKIKEQEITTFAPEVQEMTSGMVGSPTPNLPSLADRNKTKAGKSHLVRTPLLSPSNPSSPRGTVLQRSISDPGSLTPSQSQSSRRRCSPCSDGMFSCCHASFNSLKSPRRAPTLALSSPPSVVPAQQIPRLRSAPTDQVAIQREWDDRSTDDLVQEYFSKPTENERVRFYDECERKTNGPKMTRFDESIDRQDEHQRRRANSIALARAAAIDQYINNNNRFLDDTIPVEGSPESSSTSRDYRSANYQQNIPWQLRLSPNDATLIQSTDIDSYFTMVSHDGDITMDHATSQRNQVEKCSQHSIRAQEIGRKRLIEVAIKNGNIRTLPMGRNEKQTVDNIVAILRSEPQCKFSADRDTVKLVRAAYDRLKIKWPESVVDTPISSSLPPNLFSIGKDNVGVGTGNPPGIDWVSITTKGRKKQICPLKAITASIKYEGDKVVEMILVNPDYSHVDKHYECFDHRGNYLGKMDKDTMLLYAESIPYEERIALPKKDVK